MKNKCFKITKILLSVFLLMGSIVVGQVGIGTTNPDASSMLDIQSTSTGILIPRMTSAQRTTIASPALGLLVFDTSTSSFWFFSGSWTELTSGNSDLLQDNDTDTKIEVEQSADGDKIQFTTAGSERMTIDKDGNTRIGDGTNNTYIESDGSLSFEGTATRFDDLKVPVNSTNRGSTNAPDWNVFKKNGSSQGVWLWWFDQGAEEELYFVVQMPHAWKEGSDIYPHVHWTSLISATGKSVAWAIEYIWTNVNDTFGGSTVISSNSIPVDNDTNVTASKHYITSLGNINGSGKTLSSMLVCRIFRKAADSNDTFGSDVGLLEIDFHYQIDSEGSRQEFIK